jgi:RimJ/RimL family protein N-acetyltransferase
VSGVSLWASRGQSTSEDYFLAGRGYDLGLAIASYEWMAAGTAALTNAGFSIPGRSRIEIHCDPRNEPSAAIPRKLGYSLTEIRRDVETSSDDPERSTMVWTLSADEYELTWMRSI